MAHRARLPVLVLVLVVAVTGLAACATNEATRYAPSLSSVVIPLGDGKTAVTALVSMVGAPPAAREMPATIEVRLRLDNHAAQPVALAPRGLEVVTADLRSLGRPELTPSGPFVIAPGGNATLLAVFAIPLELKPTADALRALNVRFSLDVDGRTYASSVTFDRVERSYAYAAYPYGYWGSPPFLTNQVIVVHHGHHRG